MAEERPDCPDYATNYESGNRECMKCGWQNECRQRTLAYIERNRAYRYVPPPRESEKIAAPSTSTPPVGPVTPGSRYGHLPLPTKEDGLPEYRGDGTIWDELGIMTIEGTLKSIGDTVSWFFSRRRMSHLPFTRKAKAPEAPGTVKPEVPKRVRGRLRERFRRREHSEDPD